VRKLVTQLRAFKAQKGLSPKEAISLFIKTTEPELITYYMPVIAKLVNISKWDFASEKVEGSNLIVVDTHECYIPLSQVIDVEAERQKITDEIVYLEGFLTSVMKKLENENFVSKAKPDIIENERKKKADAEAKLQVLRESLMSLT
jgi:valyl-tRNA synthetase